ERRQARAEVDARRQGRHQDDAETPAEVLVLEVLPVREAEGLGARPPLPPEAQTEECGDGPDERGEGEAGPGQAVRGPPGPAPPCHSGSRRGLSTGPSASTASRSYPNDGRSPRWHRGGPRAGRCRGRKSAT